MATNQYGQNYVGNDDFRGWLAGNGLQRYLSFTGNDGNVDPRAQIVSNIDGKTVTESAMDYANDVRNLYDYWNNQRSDLNKTSGYNDTNAATNRNVANAYNESISRTNSAIDDLAGALQNRLDNIEGNYNTYKNEQQSAYNKQKSSYDTSSRQNMNDLVANRNDITNNASRSLRSLLRILGAMGAGNSSVAKYNVPEMVKAQADEQYAKAGSTYAANQANLDTNWNNYLLDHENDKKKLEDWRTGQIKTAKQDTEKERINLLNQLSQNYVDRAQYGEGYGDNLRQITDRINAANQTIKDLGRYTTPQYTGTTAVYDTPALSSYETGKMNINTGGDNNATSGSSLLAALQGLNKKKNANQFGVEA